YAQGLHGIHQTPPWAKVVVIDPQTGAEVSIGDTGLVKWIDLANVDSSVGIQTLDFAIREKEGFKLLGRAPQTERRGCSLVLGSD
ncbi:MAG: acyl-protein synthetase, partial [Verrucomicrobiota bacterium]